MFSKKILIKLIVLTLVVTLPIVFYILFFVHATVDTKVENVEPTSAFKQLLEPLYVEPKQLLFNNMILDVTEVGVTKEGLMDTPKDWNSAGWYVKSSSVGDTGNLIINGHYDDNYGRPAAFYQLKNLKINDKVSVVDKLNRVYTYKIVDSFFLEIDDPNRFNILNNTEDAELTLITCGGVWDWQKGTYDKRLVVKGELL